MVKEVIMPDMSTLDYRMESGTIEKWLKREGEHVEKGEPLLEITTAKVTMEVESPYSGTLTRILVEEGEDVPPGKVIAILE